MDAGGLAQMSHSSYNLAMPGSGLASRRGGQTLKPLSFDAIKAGAESESAVPTPRTSRSHLLAGLRTAPKSATASSFPLSPSAATTNFQMPRQRAAPGHYGNADSSFSGPKTSLPRFAQVQTYNNNTSTDSASVKANTRTQMNANANNAGQGYNQHYTPDQILAPPEIQIDEQDPATMGTDYAELVATNMYLAAQKQRLQQQLMSVQAAQQQFQTLSLGGGANAAGAQQAYQQAAYQQLLYQQQQLQQQQQQLANAGLAGGGNVYAVVDPATGQQTLYFNQGNAQLNPFVDQYNANMQQLQQLQLLQQQLQQQQQQQHQLQQHQHKQQELLPQLHQQYQGLHRQASPVGAPHVQVSPPAEMHARIPSPARRFESAEQPTPLPPPSANAFRRGHKKAASLVSNSTLTINASGAGAQEQPLLSAGPKTATFPPSALQAGAYGPGQGRAGEHPVRQPRGPPNFDELARMPTSKHEGSKNFAARTRRSAVHNLVRAGLTRRQGTAGSSGSISPISESAEELAAPLTDDESVSGRSGSGSLNGDEVECSLPSSRTSTGSWGAIGSERPGSREKVAPKGVDSPPPSEGEQAAGSFASVFKAVVASPTAAGETQRKAPMLVLTNAEKRRLATA